MNAYLVMTNVAPEDWSAHIDGTPKVIGRSPSADIRIPSRYRQVSRRHAEIWLDDAGAVWVNEAGSKSGTKVNGVWIEAGRPVRLILGDRLWLGEIELTLTANVSSAARVVAETHQCIRYESDQTTLQPRHSTAFERERLQQLTPAERDVVLWIGRGYTSDVDLGGVLDRSPNTIRTQIGSIFQKLDVSSRAELMGWLKRADVGGGR